MGCSHLAVDIPCDWCAATARRALGVGHARPWTLLWHYPAVIDTLLVFMLAVVGGGVGAALSVHIGGVVVHARGDRGARTARGACMKHVASSRY